MLKKAHLQIRCDEGLRDGLREAAKKDGLLVAEATRKAIRAYVDGPSMKNEAIWVAIAALAATLSPAEVKGFIASLKAHDDLEQMASRPASPGIALVAQVLEERNQDVC